MDRGTRWIVGLLMVLVIGLGLALILVAGDESEEPAEVTERTVTQIETRESTVTETETQPSESGGVPAP